MGTFAKQSFSKHSFAKQSFETLYQQPLPRGYFHRLAPLRYRSPDFARGLLPQTIARLRRRTGRQRLKILDLACGYGINGALLKFGVDFATFARCYQAAPDEQAAHHPLDPVRAHPLDPVRAHRLDPAGRGGEGTRHAVARDTAFLRTRPTDTELTIVGLDVSRPATEYALATGLLDAAVNTDLEHQDPTPADQAALAGADLVLATGAFSYLGPATLDRVLALQAAPPVVLGWPLYGQPTESLARCLASHRLTVTRPDPAPRHQRHFADAREREAYHYSLRRLRLPFVGSAAETSLCVTSLLARPAFS
ncbi:hypothetical protein OG455_03250 [Kitasatospora sp. NBC_01287]|uniref:hypothetical protein n=1 Tax=Kitasatospora sp. NBC_01287 TaxID=2903573 RepID=UPI00224C8666|nr:hypothetical protein [Kitasatospora sp. NBC_01287]MCX4744545.1 hypothetical protein [Kitasatospora sp. NBC_01287]